MTELSRRAADGEAVRRRAGGSCAEAKSPFPEPKPQDDVAPCFYDNRPLPQNLCQERPSTSSKAKSDPCACQTMLYSSGRHAPHPPTCSLSSAGSWVRAGSPLQHTHSPLSRAFPLSSLSPDTAPSPVPSPRKPCVYGHAIVFRQSPTPRSTCPRSASSGPHHCRHPAPRRSSQRFAWRRRSPHTCASSP